jgi:PAS domain-containing protein
MGNQEGIFERVDKNGKPLWLEAEYTPIVDSTGKVVQVVKNARNLTAQVEAETRLAEVTASLESKIRAGEQAISGVNEQISEVLEKTLISRLPLKACPDRPSRSTKSSGPFGISLPKPTFSP